MTVAESTSRPASLHASFRRLCHPPAWRFGTASASREVTVYDEMSFNSENTVHTRVKKNKNFLVHVAFVHHARRRRNIDGDDSDGCSRVVQRRSPPARRTTHSVDTAPTQVWCTRATWCRSTVIAHSSMTVRFASWTAAIHHPYLLQSNRKNVLLLTVPQGRQSLTSEGTGDVSIVPTAF
jgi:hypothetical protein